MAQNLQIDQIKLHWGFARAALSKAAAAQGAAERQAYAEEAKARIEACRFLWGWPNTVYGELP